MNERKTASSETIPMIFAGHPDHAILTGDEVRALAALAGDKKARTFEIIRSTKNVLYLREQGGKLARITPS